MENVKYIPGDLMEHITTGKICKLINISIDRDYIIEECDTHTRICTDIGRLSSIPLTPQILEANGWKMGSFERDEDDFLFQPCYKRGSILNFDYYSELSIKPVVKETRSFLSAISDIKEIRLRKIEFVHQLQHLLFGLGLDSSLKV